DRFILAVFALEDALSFARLQVEAVKEREFALGRSAPAGKKDGAALLPKNALAVGESTLEWDTGIAIAIADGALPDQPWLFAGFCYIDQEGAQPAAIAVVVAHQAGAVFHPLDRRAGAETAASAAGGNEALLQFDQLLGVVREGRPQHHEFVAEGRFSLGVAAVEGVGPDERGRLGRDPLIVARAKRNALDGNVVFQRQAGDLVFHLCGKV